MSQLAKVQTTAAPACPNCRNRVTDLDLDKLSGGAEHQCLFCGHQMRVPKVLLDRLIADRDAARAAEERHDTLLGAVKRALFRLFGK